MCFRKLILLIFIISLSISTSGCSKSGSSAEGEKVVKIKTEEELLSHALSLFNSEDIRSTSTVYTTTYEDDTTRSETEVIIYNASTASLEKSITSEDDVQRTFYIKEGTDVYCYENDESFTEGWVRFLENPDENGDTAFDYTLAEFNYSFDEESEYTDVSIKKAGNELLNGKDTVKLTVTATLTPEIEDEDAKPFRKKSGSVKRKSLLKEFGWTEESVRAVDGFSEILDQYIDYLNKADSESFTREDPVEEYIFWIDAETSEILQLQTTFSVEDTSTDISSDIEDKFWDNSWKVDWIQSDLNDGLSVEDAKLILELEGEYMEEQLAYEESLGETDDDVSEDGSYAKSVTYIKTFLTGEACPAMTSLPESYAETTYEDYYNSLDE